MSSKLSVSDIQSLCREVKKGKYKGDPADLESYKAYLGKLYYKELLTLEALKAQHDKLQLTFSAGDAHKKEELAPRIALLKSALDAMHDGGMDIDEQDKNNELKAITAVSLVMIKNNPRYSGLSAEEQTLKLDENVFYAFTVDEIIAACGRNTSLSITYDAEFIMELCKIFAKSDAAYMGVIGEIIRLSGPYEASEHYYSRVKAKLAEYRDKERIKRRQNQDNDDELLNEIETRLVARMDSCRDSKLKLSMLLAAFNPECVVYLCQNRDVKSLDKLVIEDGASFVRALEGSAKYGMTASTIKSIAPYVNVELKTEAAGDQSANIEELLAQREEAKKQAAEAQKAEDLKKLKDALYNYEKIEQCESVLKKYQDTPPKQSFEVGTVIKDVILGGIAGAVVYFGIVMAILAIAQTLALKDDSLLGKFFFTSHSLFGPDMKVNMKAYALIFAVIFICIALKKSAAKIDRQNKLVDEFRKYKEDARVELQEQLAIGNKKLEGLVPENLRKADKIRELISILEYNRADSLGEAMNIIYSNSRRNSYY